MKDPRQAVKGAFQLINILCDQLTWAYGPARFDDRGNIDLSHVEGYYNPMDLYFPAGGEKRSLYLDFAQLDARDEEAIKKFIGRYGLLGSMYRDRDYLHSVANVDGIYSPIPKDGEEPEEGTNEDNWPLSIEMSRVALLPDGEQLSEPLSVFTSEILKMQLLLAFWQDVVSETADVEGTVFMLQLLMKNLRKELPPEYQDLPEDEAWEAERAHLLSLNEGRTPEEILRLARRIIAARIKMELVGQIGMTMVIEDSHFVKKWRPLTLLSAMYLMLAEDVSRGVTVEICDNKKCGRYFIPSRKDQRYCSTICQNQDRQRRHRERKRKESAGPDEEVNL